jgi:hypothetical protein
VTSRSNTKGAGVVTTDGGHSYTEEEKVGFVTYINSRLAKDADLVGVVPIDPSNLDIITAVQGSVLLKCELRLSLSLSLSLSLHLSLSHQQTVVQLIS